MTKIPNLISSFFKAARHEPFDPDLMTEGLVECGPNRIFWKFEFGYYL